MDKLQEIASFGARSTGEGTGGSFARVMILPVGKYRLKFTQVNVSGNAYITANLSEKLYGLDLYGLDRNFGPVSVDSEYDFECFTDARLYITAAAPDSGVNIVNCQIWLMVLS